MLFDSLEGMQVSGLAVVTAECGNRKKLLGTAILQVWHRLKNTWLTSYTQFHLVLFFMVHPKVEIAEGVQDMCKFAIQASPDTTT